MAFNLVSPIGQISNFSNPQKSNSKTDKDRIDFDMKMIFSHAKLLGVGL